MIRRELEGALIQQRPATDVELLASSPTAMATAVVDIEQTVRWLVYGVAFIGFLMWLVLNSRR